MMYRFLIFLTALSLPYAAPASAEEPPIAIGSRLELMIDDHLIGSLTGSAMRRLHHPIARDVVIKHDQPWEGTGSGYHTIFRDGDLYRLYYRGADFQLQEGKLVQGHDQVTCYAESRDGLTWVKPKLGLFEFNGSKDNNIILTAKKSTHNFAPFKDTRPDVPSDQQYKALASSPHGKGLAAYVSHDGIHWKLLTDKPVITDGKFDSQNLAFWDSVQGEYRAYYRDFRKGYRDIRTATSKDFVKWEDGDWLDYGDAPRTHLYTSQVQPYPRAPHVLIGLPTRYVDHGWTGSMEQLPELEHRQLRASVRQRYGTALTDLVLMSSRDGKQFHRSKEAFLRPGPQRSGTWNYGHLYTACGLVPTAAVIDGQPDEYSIYATEGGWRSARLRRYTMRVDGFRSIRADETVGELRTKPIVFEGKRLVLNMSASAAGFIKVVLRDADGKEYPGFGINDAEPLFGDTIAREVQWKGDPDLGQLAGKPVEIRFVLKEADLFSFQFQ